MSMKVTGVFLGGTTIFLLIVLATPNHPRYSVRSAPYTGLLYGCTRADATGWNCWNMLLGQPLQRRRSCIPISGRPGRGSCGGETEENRGRHCETWDCYALSSALGRVESFHPFFPAAGPFPSLTANPHAHHYYNPVPLPGKDSALNLSIARPSRPSVPPPQADGGWTGTCGRYRRESAANGRRELQLPPKSPTTSGAA